MSIGIATRGHINKPTDAGSDFTAPLLTVISPPPGSTIGPNTPIKFRYSDETGMGRPLPMFKFLQPEDGSGIPKYKYELVHDGDNFTPDYDGVRTQISFLQYEYTVTRKGGWSATLQYVGGSPILVPFGADTAGNEVV